MVDFRDMTESGAGDDRARSLLAECMEDPERAKRRLPAILGLLEHQAAETRLAAASACCLLAESDPDILEYVLDRLAERLTDDEVSLELTHALDYLVDRHPVAAAEALDGPALETPAGGHDGPTAADAGPFTRSHYYDRGGGRGGVGRIRYPGTDGRDDPRQTYTQGEPDEQERAERRAALAEAAEDEEGESGGAGDDESTADEEPGDAADSAGTSDATAADDGALVRQTADVTAIADRSRFEQLHILATRDRSRYATEYRALVGDGAEEQAILLRVLEVPDGDEAVEFPARARTALEQWDRVADHEHVVSLLDWDVEPRPWLATGVAGQPLGHLVPMDHEDAISVAIDLADALAHVHRSDVVHGGIDPANVAYPGDLLEHNDQEPPLVNNVGLVECYRQYRNPATLLDPRYAAPEYFDRRFGVVDAATDIYQLGAVLFALYAGRPPYGGPFGAVRDAVTSPMTPVPGDVATGVPAAVDEVVAKAMATRKLTRYETIEHLGADLRAVREAGEG